MTCIWKVNLDRQRVTRSNRYSQKQFLHANHWIQPKSRECDKHIWSVDRLRLGPVAESLKRQVDRLALKDNSIFTHHHLHMCTTDNHSRHKNTFTFEEAHAYGMHQQTNEYALLTSLHQFGSITIIWTHSCCYFQLPI